MLGSLMASIDKPNVAMNLVAALEDPGLVGRLTDVAEATGRSPAEIVASAIRNFAETAPDDLWTQIIGIMNRAQDPTLAAFRAILQKALTGKDL